MFKALCVLKDLGVLAGIGIGAVIFHWVPRSFWERSIEFESTCRDMKKVPSP